MSLQIRTNAMPRAELALVRLLFEPLFNVRLVEGMFAGILAECLGPCFSSSSRNARCRETMVLLSHNFAISTLALRPMSASRSGDVLSARVRVSANASLLGCHDNQPDRPSDIISAIPPSRVAITGSPDCMASIQVLGKFSQRDGTTAMRAPFSRFNRLGPFR